MALVSIYFANRKRRKEEKKETRELELSYGSSSSSWVVAVKRPGWIKLQIPFLFIFYYKPVPGHFTQNFLKNTQQNMAALLSNPNSLWLRHGPYFFANIIYYVEQKVGFNCNLYMVYCWWGRGRVQERKRGGKKGSGTREGCMQYWEVETEDGNDMCTRVQAWR